MAETNKYLTCSIYFIRSPSTEKIYIGAVNDYYIQKAFLALRSRHKCSEDQEKLEYHDIFKNNDAYVDLYHQFSCDSQQEMLKEKASVIFRFPNSVNKKIGLGTTEKVQCNCGKVVQWPLHNHNKTQYHRNNIHKTKYIKVCDLGNIRDRIVVNPMAWIRFKEDGFKFMEKGVEIKRFEYCDYEDENETFLAAAKFQKENSNPDDYEIFLRNITSVNGMLNDEYKRNKEHL